MPDTLRGIRALVVEDNPVQRELLRLALEQYGIEVTEATNGAEALACFDAMRFDVALLDYMLPELGGIAVLREMRAREALSRGRRRTPVVMISAAMDTRHQYEALIAGAEYYLPKPYERATLIGVIAHVLGRLPPLGG